MKKKKQAEDTKVKLKVENEMTMPEWKKKRKITKNKRRRKFKDLTARTQSRKRWSQVLLKFIYGSWSEILLQIVPTFELYYLWIQVKICWIMFSKIDGCFQLFKKKLEMHPLKSNCSTIKLETIYFPNYEVVRYNSQFHFFKKLKL